MSFVEEYVKMVTKPLSDEMLMNKKELSTDILAIQSKLLGEL